MADFTLRITTGNAAMQDVFDISDALKKVAERLYNEGDNSSNRGIIRDTNGNRVGEWSHDDLVIDEDEED